MKIDNQGVELIKQFEGLSLSAYQDPVGIWTIGYGWTHPVDGEPIGAGMYISQIKAVSLLIESLGSYERDVSRLINVSVTQNQFNALVDFAYNLGISALADSTLLRKLNSGDMDGAANEFMRWCHAGNKVLPGLVRRREAERILFLS